ncbi:unnamed protein product [Arctogadus glacialis]
MTYTRGSVDPLMVQHITCSREAVWIFCLAVQLSCNMRLHQKMPISFTPPSLLTLELLHSTDTHSSIWSSFTPPSLLTPPSYLWLPTGHSILFGL